MSSLQGGLINFEKHRRVGVLLLLMFFLSAWFCLFFCLLTRGVFCLFFVLTYSFSLWQEFEILSQIRQLQASCSQYSLPVDPRITSWVQAHTLLTDQERWDACLQTTYRENIHLPAVFSYFFKSVLLFLQLWAFSRTGASRWSLSQLSQLLEQPHPQ